MVSGLTGRSRVAFVYSCVWLCWFLSGWQGARDWNGMERRGERMLLRGRLHYILAMTCVSYNEEEVEEDESIITRSLPYSLNADPAESISYRVRLKAAFEALEGGGTAVSDTVV